MKVLHLFSIGLISGIVGFGAGTVSSPQFQSDEAIAREYASRLEDAHKSFALSWNEWLGGEFKSLYEESGIRGIRNAKPSEPYLSKLRSQVKGLLPFAEHGDPSAAAMVGRSLLLGDLLPQDICKAIPLIDSSARAGNPLSAFMLSNLYWDGNHLDRDEILHMFWILEARHHDATFRQYLNVAIMGTMSKAERDEWMARWFEWSPQKNDPISLPDHCL